MKLYHGVNDRYLMPDWCQARAHGGAVDASILIAIDSTGIKAVIAIDCEMSNGMLS